MVNELVIAMKLSNQNLSPAGRGKKMFTHSILLFQILGLDFPRSGNFIGFQFSNF